MSRDQNAGQKGYIQIGNKSFETAEQFKYLGKTLTNQNSFHEEIKSRFKSGNACYHSVQNLLSSSLLSKNLKIKIYRTITKSLMLCTPHQISLGWSSQEDWDGQDMWHVLGRGEVHTGL
jgi:hypothetical protein